MAKSLRVGTRIKMKAGDFVTVGGILGHGGQGDVYEATYMGNRYALKWYHTFFLDSMSDVRGYYENLSTNITNGSPGDMFLWPKGITVMGDDSFGYIMDIRPPEYSILTDWFLAKTRYKSISSVINTAIQLISGFRNLHNRGYSYQDINNENFFINFNTGDVLICDNDNVSPWGINFGIIGKQRWMAPEIVTGKNMPDVNSDLFSLSLLLFRLLYINHPLEGKYSTPPCLTESLQKKYYGEAPVFIYDPFDDRNRPIKGNDYNLKLFRNVYPDFIWNLFIQAFSQDVMLGRAPRILEIRWLDAFFKAKALIGECPFCKSEMFYKESGPSTCPSCKKQVKPVEYCLDLGNGKGKYPLFPGMNLYQWIISSRTDDPTKIVGKVVIKDGEIGIENTSGSKWYLKANEKQGWLEINNGGGVKARDGFQIQFDEGNFGKISKYKKNIRSYYG